MRVRVDTVSPDSLTRLRILKVAEVFHFVRDEVELINVSHVVSLYPYLVFGRSAVQCKMPELAPIRVPFLRCRPYLKLLGLPIELCDGALIHYAHPWIVILVEFKIERAFRPA